MMIKNNMKPINRTIDEQTWIKSSIPLPLMVDELSAIISDILLDNNYLIETRNARPTENERTAIRHIKLLDNLTPEICRRSVCGSIAQFLEAMYKIRTDWVRLEWTITHTEIIIGLVY